MIWRFIGLRHLTSRKKQTLIAVLAVGLGIGIVLSSVALTNGFQSQLTDTIRDTSPDVEVTSDGGLIRTYGLYVSQVRGIEGVDAATPFITGNAVVESGTRETSAIVKGVEPREEMEIFGFGDSIAAGSFTSISGSTREAVIGSGIADELEVELGESVTLATPSGSRKFTVTGILDTGTFLDDRYVYLDFSTAQDFLGRGHAASGIDVGTEEPERVAVAVESGTGLKTETWMEATQAFTQVMSSFDLVRYLFYVLILAIASAGIANVMLITVMTKTREIGMLKSMGATDREVMTTFLFEGGVLAGAGAAFGNVMAVVLTHGMSQIEVSPPSGARFGHAVTLAVDLTPKDALFVSGFTVLLTVVFSVYPAYKAAKLEPVEALSRE